MSAAYYAVFHRLCINVAWSAVPTGPDQVRWELCRAFDHKSVENIAKWVGGHAFAPASSPGVAGLVAAAQESPELVTFANGFRQLKGLRADADYNHLTTFGRDLALSTCRTAGHVLDALDSVYGQPHWMSFASLVLLKGTR